MYCPDARCWSTVPCALHDHSAPRMATDSSREQKIQLPKMATSSRLSWLAQLDIDREPASIRKTSIICTLGPKTSSVEQIVALRNAGMNVARLNFSHGSHEFHAGTINNVRKSFEECPGRPVAIALDTKGPEIRTGEVAGGSLAIPKGHEFVLTTDEACKPDGNLERVYIDYTRIGESVDVGKLVYVDDGNLQLEVIERLGDKGVRVRALNSHKLLNRKGVNLPYSRVFLPPLSEKDKVDLAFGAQMGVDMIFASFIRTPDDVRQIRAVLNNNRILIIAKIENHEGVKNFDEILSEADGIMVARGDLGVEIPPQKVFIAQKMMITRSNLAGKPCICATQMLESMTQNPRPTRAEVSDVANAVLDGADCVMLSAETASGNYPFDAVKTMSSICVEAESTIAYLPLFSELRKLFVTEQTVTETIACSAVSASLEGYISGIVVLTTTGLTAHLLAKFRPQVPIIAITRDSQTARQIHLWRGCYPLVYNGPELVGENWQAFVEMRFNWAVKESKRMGLIRQGGSVIFIQGDEKGSGHTNTMRILPVDDI